MPNHRVPDEVKRKRGTFRADRAPTFIGSVMALGPVLEGTLDTPPAYLGEAGRNTSTSILTESERWTGGRVEAEPERVVILGPALEGVPVATLDHVPRNTLLRLDATAKVTGGWPEDAKALRISFVSDTTQRDLERGEIVIARGHGKGGTRVNLRANVPGEHPVELAAAATFEGGANVAAPRLLGVTRVRLTTAVVESPFGSEVAARGGPPPGGGLTRDDIVEAVIEHREPDGTWPTQPTVSLALGRDEGGRRIRQVQGPGGWAGILKDAEATLARTAMARDHFRDRKREALRLVLEGIAREMALKADASRVILKIGPRP